MARMDRFVSDVNVDLYSTTSSVSVVPAGAVQCAQFRHRIGQLRRLMYVKVMRNHITVCMCAVRLCFPMIRSSLATTFVSHSMSKEKLFLVTL